jgi:hypothetical protein
MNNEPAFPLHNHGAQTLGMHLSGMTLRDYFAAKAMQGILSGYTHGSIPPTESLTPASYKIADAMLKEREA